MDIVKQLTVAQLWAAIVSVALIITQWKSLRESLIAFYQDCKTGFPSLRKWMNRERHFKKTILTKLDTIQKEVAYNGGSVRLSDAVKRIEDKVENLTVAIEYNRVLRGISDKFSERMIFKMNKSGACIEINDSFLKFYGWQESDVLDYGFENIVHEDDVAEMRLKWQKAINTMTDFKDEQRIKDCHGVYHTCSVRAYALVVNGVLKDFSGTIDKI